VKGLFLKDAYVLWENSKFSIFVALFFMAFSLASGIDRELETNYLAAFPFLFVGVLPINLLAYDENYRWDSYAAAMPYTKAQIVSVKYIFALVMNLSIFCVQLIATAFKAYVLRLPMAGELIFDTGMFLSFGILLPSFLLPIIFKFGVQKSRIIYIIFYVLVYGAFSLLSNIDNDHLPRITLGLPSIIALVCAVLLGLYALSWALSVKFYMRREF